VASGAGAIDSGHERSFDTNMYPRHTHLASFILIAFALAACGGGKPVDRSNPQAVVDGWFAAAKAGDRDAMLDLIDAKQREHEATSERAFTNVIGAGKIKLVAFEARDPIAVEGDTAKARYRAKFLDESGETSTGLREHVRQASTKVREGPRAAGGVMRPFRRLAARTRPCTRAVRGGERSRG
jgi:hypothetical protein